MAEIIGRHHQELAAVENQPAPADGFLQVKNWARAFTPGALLGVYTPDELEEIPARERDITPRTAAEFAEHAKPKPAEAVDRVVIIRDLEMIARSKDAPEKRVADLKDAWMNLGKDGRAAVGKNEIARIQAIAQAEDAPPAQQQAKVDQETGEVTTCDDNAFDGVADDEAMKS